MGQDTIAIIGIGEAKLDHYAHYDVKDRDMIAHVLGGDTFVDWERLCQIKENLSLEYVSPGGSILNSLSVLGQMGHHSYMIGYQPYDPDNVYATYTKDYRITPSFYPHNKPGKGNLLVLVDRETKERSFLNADYSGTAKLPELIASKRDIDHLEKAEIILLEGYDWLIPAKRVFQKHVAYHYKQDNQDMLLSLSDISVIKQSGQELYDFIEDHVDILFGNEEEYKKLFNEQHLDNIIKKLEDFSSNKLYIVTASDKGAYAIHQGRSYFTESIPVRQEEIINTNGAGDNFTAAFVNAYLKAGRNKDEALIKQALKAGHEQAALCVRSATTVPGGHQVAA